MGLELDESWSFDVAEYLPNENELYNYLTFGIFSDSIPSFNDCKKDLCSIFQKNKSEKGLMIRQTRFLWTACVKNGKSASL